MNVYQKGAGKGKANIIACFKWLDIYKKQVNYALPQIESKESHLHLEMHWGPTKTE